MSERPDWLEEGQPVAIVTGYQNETVRLSTVERFTKTRVVLANEEWYPLVDLTKRHGSFSYSHLADPNSARVVTAIRLQQVKHLSYEIDRAARNLDSGATVDDWLKIYRIADKLSGKASAGANDAEAQS